MVRKYSEANDAATAKELYADMQPTKRGAIDDAARKCLRFKDRYVAVEKATGVPWDFIAVLHMRESNNDFRGVLHNGEKIIGTGRKTRLVPARRGPFDTWEEAAVDALRIKGWVGKSDWDIGTKLARAQQFNGLGYFNRGVRSPYVWGGTNLQQPGKYVADHVWSKTHMDKQLGVAPVLARIAELDKSKAVPGGKIYEKLNFIQRAYEAIVAGFMAWLTTQYENMTIDNMIAYATDIRTLAIVGVGLALYWKLLGAKKQVVKAHKEGNYYTNDELDEEENNDE
jgi:lysozyme family protein